MQKDLSQYSFMVLKPDAVRQFLDINILQGLEGHGLKIVKRKMITFTADQAAELYTEKSEYNYFPILVDFMSEGPSLCLILEADNCANVTEKAKVYRDWARTNLRIKQFELSKQDMEQLRAGTHPLQKDITRTMALENLIHVSDDLVSQRDLINQLFTRGDLNELRDRDGFLYNFLNQQENSYLTVSGERVNLR